MVLSGKNAQQMSVETLAGIPIVTKSGDILQLDQLAEIKIVSSPRQIRRLGGRQALSIQLRPEESMALEDAIKIVESKIISEIRSEASEKNVFISLRGAASELTRTWDSMQINVLTAIGVILLLLVILLKSFFLPIIILLVVPVASTGGILGLAVFWAEVFLSLTRTYYQTG